MDQQDSEARRKALSRRSASSSALSKTRCSSAPRALRREAGRREDAARRIVGAGAREKSAEIAALPSARRWTSGSRRSSRGRRATKWRDQYPRTRYQAPNVTRLFQVTFRSLRDGDVVLRLLHTADWHLGRRFPIFPEEAQKKLSRARLDVVSRILNLARRQSVRDPCAGDVFDDPTPVQDFWEGLVKLLRDQTPPPAPLFFVPGNHDPLTAESVWAPHHPFRANLPAWVQVVDRDDFRRADIGSSPLRTPVPFQSRRERPRHGAAGTRPWRYADSHRLSECTAARLISTATRRTSHLSRRRCVAWAELPRDRRYALLPRRHARIASAHRLSGHAGAHDVRRTWRPARVALVALFRQGLRPRVSAENVAFGAGWT